MAADTEEKAVVAVAPDIADEPALRDAAVLTAFLTDDYLTPVVGLVAGIVHIGPPGEELIVQDMYIAATQDGSVLKGFCLGRAGGCHAKAAGGENGAENKSLGKFKDFHFGTSQSDN